MDQWLLGNKLKRMRLKKRLSLQKAAKKVSISAAFLSMVENGHSGIGISNLHTLLDVYNAKLSDLYEEPSDNNIVLPLEQAEKIDYDYQGVSGRILIREFHKKRINALHLRFEPGAVLGPLKHKGEEISFIIEGSFAFKIEDKNTGETETYIANKWDTVTHNGDSLHSVKNLSDTPSELHTVIYNIDDTKTQNE